jgi:DNA-binding response OmpR family regulator
MNEPFYRILLVEDDATLRFIIKDNLELNHFGVDIAEDGEMALRLFHESEYSLIILDVMLPKVDGFTVAREIRKVNDQIPVLFLTARSMNEDKITGLTLGGDDYITKPFSMEELLLKMKIFLRRSTTSSPFVNTTESQGIKIGKYLFSEQNLALACGDFQRRLTLKEAELVKYFANNSNKVLSRDEILQNVWGSNDYFLGRSLDVFISRLRKYFSLDPDIRIVNLHGIGFRFNIKTVGSLL